MKALRQRLLNFYSCEARELPWRTTDDAYRIWVSEIMLQQTQVATVIARYEPFLRRFPDVASLAAAGVDAVCEEWAGLGYYSRARNMHRAAEVVVRDHAGKLPEDPGVLSSLPGIGAYTAGAIASIAYGQPEAAVDANAERVLCRLFAIDEAAGASRTARVWEFARELAATTEAGRVNQALMDLAAGYCRPKKPACEACPLSEDCAGTASGHPEAYPLPKRKPARRRLEVAMLWVQRADGHVLLEQRPPSGLWAGQWQLPCEEGEGAAERLSARMNCEPRCAAVQVRHLLTHREVVADVYTSTNFFEQGLARTQWTPVPRTAPVNALSRKVIDLMLQ